MVLKTIGDLFKNHFRSFPKPSEMICPNGTDDFSAALVQGAKHIDTGKLLLAKKTTSNSRLKPFLSPYSDLDCVFQFVFAKENHIAATSGATYFPT